jgi:hypothetical protein
VEKGQKLGQLQFSLFVRALQNPNITWHSCSNHREKHRTTSANVVEGCLIYNFRIYHFCRTVQLFGEICGQRRVDWLEISRSCSRAPPARRCHVWRPAPRSARFAASASVRARPPPPRGQSRRSPSRLPPRNACRSASTRVAPALANRVPTVASIGSFAPPPLCRVRLPGPSRYTEELRWVFPSLLRQEATPVTKAARRAASRTPQRPSSLLVRRSRGAASSS